MIFVLGLRIFQNLPCGLLYLWGLGLGVFSVIWGCGALGLQGARSGGGFRSSRQTCKVVQAPDC